MAVKNKKINLNIKEDVIANNEIDTTNIEKEQLIEDNKIIINSDILSKEETGNKLELESITTDNKKRFKRWQKLLIFIVIILFVVLLGFIFFPIIELKGQKEMTINYKEKYIEPGYNILILNKKVSLDTEVNSNIKEGIVGNYEVNYSYSLLGLKIKKTRKVNIIDNVKPVITTKEDNVKVCPNKDIPEIEYEALDEYDGNITSKVEKTINDNEIIFNVKDNSNNLTSVSVKLDRTDDERPKIKLKGNASMFITYGNNYKEPGYTATDNCSGELTSKVKVIGNVSREIGKYQIRYEVEDENGNKSTVVRSVVVGTKVNDNGNIKKGTIYLTFDDGPNQGTTNKILDILKTEGVKATFFVTCKGPDNLIKRMQDEGHTIALHTASHEYSYVYSSVDNYFTDLYKVRDRVKRITGIDSKIVRFPGGSSNTTSRNYSKGIMTVLTNAVLNEGYHYFDWNVDGMDASSSRNSKDVYYNVTSNLSHNKANVVLLHDIKSITVGALKDIIKFGKEQGYEFSAIDMNTYMVRHKVNN